MNSLLRYFSFTLVAVGLGACVPKIYVVDRQTVLEEEAAGHWPQFDKEILSRAKEKGPTPFAGSEGVSGSGRRERLYNVLNGPLPLNGPTH